MRRSRLDAWLGGNGGLPGICLFRQVCKKERTGFEFAAMARWVASEFSSFRFLSEDKKYSLCLGTSRRENRLTGVHTSDARECANASASATRV